MFVKRYLLVMIDIIKKLLVSIIVTNFQVRWNPHFTTIYFFNVNFINNDSKDVMAFE